MITCLPSRSTAMVARLRGVVRFRRGIESLVMQMVRADVHLRAGGISICLS